jgi:RNA binding exosome subunit
MFLNSLGGYEVLRFVGQATEVTDAVKNVIQKFLPANYSALDGEFEVNQSILAKKMNYSSGYIKDRFAKEWHDYMVDLLLSSRVYNVTNGKRMPIVITAGQHEEDDQNYLRYVRFDARPAYDDDSFTPKTI